MAGGSAAESERRSRDGIVGALNREWDVLVRAHRGTANRWAASYEALTRCTSLDEVVHRTVDRPDAVLAALLAEVARGEAVAARAVLQSMIGRIIAMARRDQRAGVEDYLSALWCVIHSYPLARRPTKIAANLSMETLKMVSGERRWFRHAEVSPWPPHAFLEPAYEFGRFGQQVGGPDALGVLATGLELGLVDRAAAGLLRSVYVDGLSSEEAARRHGSTPGSVRVRCSRSVRRLAAASDQLAEVA